jgi:hypothetical protein
MENISELVVRVPSFETAFFYANALPECQVCVTTSLKEVVNESGFLLSGIEDIPEINQVEDIRRYVKQNFYVKPRIRILITNNNQGGLTDEQRTTVFAAG